MPEDATSGTPQNDTGGAQGSMNDSGGAIRDDGTARSGGTEVSAQETATQESPAEAAAAKEPAAAKTPLLGGELVERPEHEVPEEYADFSVPEGLVVDAELLGEFKQQAKEMGLSQAQAQGLIDLQVKASAAQGTAFERQMEQWQAEITADPEFGGQHLKQTVSDAKRVLAAYPEGAALQQELVRTGYGNNPQIIRFLARIGREHYREDSVLTGKEAPKRDDRPLAERLWPDN